MPEGGKLTLESKNVVLDESYVGSNREVAAGNYVMIAVSDSGCGIAVDHLDRVFEPFFTTKEVGKGTGLGLSMVYGFIRQSNGHIKVYSEVGHGTTVKIYLPQATGAARPLAEDPSQACIVGGDEAILIVEDDALVRRCVVTQVQSLGYRTLAAGNASEALTIIDNGEEIDLLFTDVVMPGSINGRQLAIEALNRRPSLKVLYTSGYTKNAMIHHGHLDTEVLLLAKPYRKVDLAKMIRTALAA
jgi:CheY-like chemotaxis protein